MLAQETPGSGQGARGIDRWMPLVLALLFLLALAGGVALLVQPGDGSGVEVLLPQPTATPTLKAYAAGAVTRPGVYPFSDGDRLDHLLRLAGGPLEDADASGLNLALRLRDEGHYYIPTVGETPPLPFPPADETWPASPDAGVSADGRLDLNTASAEQLQTLPGVGAVRAEAIIVYREQDGPFARVEDLLLVPGIGQGTLNAVGDQIMVR